MSTRTTSSLINISFGDITGVVYCTQLAYDIYTNELIFASIVGYKGIIDEINKVMIKSRESVSVRASGVYCMKNRGAQYIMDTRKNENSDLVHATIFLKDNSKMDSNSEAFSLYMYVNESDANKEARLKELLYDKLYKYSSVPMIPEWIDYIYSTMKNERVLRDMQVVRLNEVEGIEVYKYVGNQESLKNIIQTGLRSGAINIAGNNNSSVLLEDISGLNDYLAIFGSMLAEKIQNKFAPKFTPGTDEYSNYLNNIDDYMHHKGIELYEAQMAVIESTARNWNINKHGIIVGEMGCGNEVYWR